MYAAKTMHTERVDVYGPRWEMRRYVNGHEVSYTEATPTKRQAQAEMFHAVAMQLENGWDIKSMRDVEIAMQKGDETKGFVVVKL